MRATTLIFGSLLLLAGCDSGMISSAAELDTDHDGLTDRRESELGTDPENADTDGDGRMDGDEVDHGDDPLNNDREHPEEHPEENPEEHPEENPEEHPEENPEEHACWGDGECAQVHERCELGGHEEACVNFERHCTERCVPREDPPHEEPPPPADNVCWGEGECGQAHERCELGHEEACVNFERHCTETCTPREEPPPPENACWGERDCAEVHARCEEGGADACENFERHCTEGCGH